MRDAEAWGTASGIRNEITAGVARYMQAPLAQSSSAEEFRRPRRLDSNHMTWSLGARCLLLSVRMPQVPRFHWAVATGVWNLPGSGPDALHSPSHSQWPVPFEPGKHRLTLLKDALRIYEGQNMCATQPVTQRRFVIAEVMQVCPGRSLQMLQYPVQLKFLNLVETRPHVHVLSDLLTSSASTAHSHKATLVCDGPPSSTSTPRPCTSAAIPVTVAGPAQLTFIVTLVARLTMRRSDLPQRANMRCAGRAPYGGRNATIVLSAEHSKTVIVSTILNVDVWPSHSTTSIEFACGM